MIASPCRNCVLKDKPKEVCSITCVAIVKLQRHYHEQEYNELGTRKELSDDGTFTINSRVWHDSAS